MTEQPLDALALLEELRSPTQWCCIFEHEGAMRHGTTDAPFRAADTIAAQAAEIAKLQAMLAEKDEALQRYVNARNAYLATDVGTDAEAQACQELDRAHEQASAALQSGAASS